MLVLFDPHAARDRRVYVVDRRPDAGAVGGVIDRELPGRFARVQDALRAYPGATVDRSVFRTLRHMVAATHARFRTPLRIPVG